MVAAVNGVTEYTVNSLLKQGKTFSYQLLNPEQKIRRVRDVNKIPEEPLIKTGDVVWTWDFVKFLEYIEDPSSYNNTGNGPARMYQYYLKQNLLPDTQQILGQWLIMRSCDISLRLSNAKMGMSGETYTHAIHALYEKFKTFDRNLLKRRVPPPLVKESNELSQNERKRKLLESYIDLVHLLPPTELKDAIATMLKYKEVEWIKQ